MKVGLIGLPGSGVTTLFSLFTGRNYQDVCQNAKSEVNLGDTKVPDDRIDALAKIFNPKKKVYATIEFADVPVELDPSGSFSTSTINHLRNMDALAVVIRAFDNPAVAHSKVTIDPLRDFQSMCDEALLTDLMQIEKKVERLTKEGKIKSREGELFQKLKTQLENSLPIRDMGLTPDDERELAGFRCFTQKPWLVLLNTDQSGTIAIESVTEACRSAKIPCLSINAGMEREISELSEEEQAEFLKDLGVETGARNRFIREAYSLLDLISFLTVGEDECRAWPVQRNSDAVTAAGKIHTDLARGFIRAEVISYAEFMAAGDMNRAKKAGKLRLEGKNYIVLDGDILNIRFSV